MTIPAPGAPVRECVFVVSDRPLASRAIRLVLDPVTWRDVRAVREVADLDPRPASPPLVMLDMDAPLADADAATVRALLPGSTIVAMSADREGAVVLEALRAGARAFVRVPDELLGLGDVLRQIDTGETVLAGDLRRLAAEELGRLARRVRFGERARAGLTVREREVLPLLAEGLTSRQIGTRLSLSARTVEHHASTLYRKLDAHSRVEAVAHAAAFGLVDVR
jgi:DNA-binding NarL/FixJ family response regulator